MKIKSNLFLVLILVSSLCGQALAMDQCKEAVKIIGLGMGCGFVLGAANKAYISLRLENDVPPSIIASVSGGAIIIGAPAAAGALLGPLPHLKAEDVMIPMGMTIAGLFFRRVVMEEYTRCKRWQQLLGGPVLEEASINTVGRCIKMGLAIGFLPSYLVWQRFRNA